MPEALPLFPEHEPSLDEPSLNEPAGLLSFDDEEPPPPPLMWRPAFTVGVDLTDEEALRRELLTVKLALGDIFGNRVSRLEAFATTDALARRYLQRFERLMAGGAKTMVGPRRGPKAAPQRLERRNSQAAG